MNTQANAQTSGKPGIVNSLDRGFARLHFSSCAIIESTPAALLYESGAQGSRMRSVGEGVLRCAATIEQTFGGITARLWDDPFEWTLPEYLSTPAKVLDHLGEVEATRKRAFGSFTDDSCLLQQVATPARETPLVELLIETLVRGAYYQSEAAATLKSLSGIGSPGFII